MIPFLLKASIIIGIVLLFYKLFLQKESFFAVNRIFLLGSLFLAFLLPLITLPPLVNHQGFIAEAIDQIYPTTSQEIINVPEEIEGEAVIVDPVSEPSTHQNNSSQLNRFSWVFWIKALYAFGVIILFLNILFQITTLLFKIRKNKDKVIDLDCVIVNSSKRQSPCSFFKYIFIHPDKYDFSTYEQIIAHEKIHVKQGHSFDLLLAEVAVILLWFNPLIWLYKQEMEKNIEFQTDDILLRGNSVLKKQYQINLVQIANQNKPLSITTNYNQSLLKQRILMMNSKKSSIHGYWKYAFLLPLFFCTLLLINKPVLAQTVIQESSNSLKDQVEVESNSSTKNKTKSKSKISKASNYDDLYIVISPNTTREFLEEMKERLADFDVIVKYHNMNFNDGKLTAISLTVDMAGSHKINISNENDGKALSESIMFYQEKNGFAGSATGETPRKISSFGRKVLNGIEEGMTIYYDGDKMVTYGNGKLMSKPK